ncbi:hypothetical protein Poli38472_013155 [Pythium oligandrum]|uniref:Protein kinase domain-containing protein n=1 Tax=Pythium oligandrum TaxID=41045 RepID=A0A8K1C2L0_PYTOL|nr:hypothetical protein Poli38472_013155 [Pythium oligandrum]|eukprot:TMW55264.1 hypothetical protein Poli38472_013155 [Pythium oligandrum]
MMTMASLHLEDPLRIQVVTPSMEDSKTVYVRMRDLQGSVAIELSPALTSIHDVITRFHELAFDKSYATYVEQSALLGMRIHPVTKAPQEVPLQSVDDLRDLEVLVYKPCEELRALVEQGCITPVLASRSRPSSPASSPLMKRKGRCASVANNIERVHRYAGILEDMDVSPRERSQINDLLINGDEQVVDAMETFSMSRNTASIRRALQGRTKTSSVEHLSTNFAELEMQSPAGTSFYDTQMHSNEMENPFFVANLSPVVVDAENPFLVTPTKATSSPALKSAGKRPSLMFEDITLTTTAPVFLHSIKEKQTPPSRMNLSLDDLDSSFDETAPQLFSVAALLDNVPVGRNFHECYAIGGVLGSGKYSVVKECTNIHTGERFAAKIIDKRQMMEIRFLKRELEIMHTIRHDGVVQLIELFETNEELFLVMELCTQELFEYIDRNGPLEEPIAQRLIARLVSTVAYLHGECIVHRDIKPENILIRGADVYDIKLTDFGIARKLEGANCTLTPHESLSEVANLHDPTTNLSASGVRNRMARAHTKCGTRDYVAPEVMSGKGYGSEADLWSVGVVTYVLLSGCAPIFLPSADGTKKVFFTEDCWQDVSDECKRFIEALLVRNPEERSTAEEALQLPWLQSVL